MDSSSSVSTPSCKGCDDKDERIKKISDGIKQKIEAYTELSADCPLPVSHLITSVLNVLHKFNPSPPKKEEHNNDSKPKEKERQPEENVSVNVVVQETPQTTTPVKSSSSSSSHTFSSSQNLPLSTTNEALTFGDRKRKRKLSGCSSSSASSTCTLPVKKQPIRIQTPDISSSCSSPRPTTPSTNFDSNAIPGPSSRSSRTIIIKSEVQETINPHSQIQVPIIPKLTPVEEALTNSVVLKNIFKYLNYDDLQSCSTVTEWKMWKEEAEGVMSRRTVFTICFSKKKPKICMTKSVHDNHIRSEYRDIEHLSTTLEEEGRGNEMWISVLQLELATKILSDFMKKFAPFITRLTLYYGALQKMSPQTFHKLLLILHNVSQLSLATIPSDWKLRKEAIPLTFSSSPSSSSSSSSTNRNGCVDKSLLLPRMKSISFKASAEFYPEFIQSLLQVTPNVKYVFNLPLHTSKKVLSNWTKIPSTNNNNKTKNNSNPNSNPSFQLDKIKSVHFSSSDRTPSAGPKMKTDLAFIASIASRLGLVAVHLSFKMAPSENSFEMWLSCCESLSKIFQDNNQSIKYLKIEPFPQPQYLVYPDMPALKKLHLFSSTDWKKIEHEAQVCKFFSEEFNITETFPNLTKVKFEGMNCALGEFFHFFPDDIFTSGSGSGFQNVTSLNLKFQRLEDEKSLQKAASLFPGVKNFSMDGDVQWLETRLIHILHHWPRLKKLKLTVDVVMSSVRLPSIQMYPLDSVFTGIPEVKCAELRESEEKRDIIIHEWQENVAISNMTELTELRLIFSGNLAKTQKVFPLFSHVTPLYGFQLLPNLKVTFAIPFDNIDNERIQKMLEPIKKYVDFQPNYH